MSRTVGLMMVLAAAAATTKVSLFFFTIDRPQHDSDSVASFQTVAKSSNFGDVDANATPFFAELIGRFSFEVLCRGRQ